MVTAESSAIGDLEDARRAFARLCADIDAQDPRGLAPMNVDVVGAASMVLGVLPRLMTLRERAAGLVEFDVRCFDRLGDCAKALWFLHVTNPPPVAPEPAAALVSEVKALRARLLLWAEPLAASGRLSRDALGRIRGGAGFKDAASDLVALVALYRSCWDDVRASCAVTEQELDRGAELGPAVFAALSRKGTVELAPSPQSLRVRQAWTLLDRSYRECQRAVQFLRFHDGDAGEFAPSLRRNAGRPARTPEKPGAEPVVRP